MPETRFSTRRRVWHAIAWVGWLFLALSFWGYDPLDPPGDAIWPPRAVPSNPCGPVGAALAFFGFAVFGRALWAAVWAIAARLWLRSRSVALDDPRGVALGLALVLVVASAFAHAIDRRRGAATFAKTPPVGGGGYLGAFLVSFAEGQLGRAGIILVFAALGVGGLILCGEALFLRPIQEVAALLRARFSSRRAGSIDGPVGDPYPALSNASYQILDETRSFPRIETAGNRPLDPSPRPLPAVNERRGDRSAIAPAQNILPQTGDGTYRSPPAGLLDPPAPFPIQEHEAKVGARAMLLERTLLEHGCQVRVVQIDTGPVITQFEIELEAGLRVSRVAGLANDLAIALAVPSVRIVAPIPGKTTVGIEVPNERRAMVRLGEVIQASGVRVEEMRVPLFLGKDVKGNPLAFDLAEMPHLLIAGRTGTGKSVCLNAMILSILMTKRPDEVKMILIDPKMVELSQFKRIPHLMHPVVTDMKKAEALLSWACDKMDERYGFLARAGVRNLQTYNQLGAEEIYARLRPEDEEEMKRIPTYMPSIVIIADEMADLMMTAAKEVESHIVRLAQKARAVGMHLIVATQKPTVDVITGLIKGNLPARISFQVASRGDSRVILDEMGADKLLGNGDMLFLVPGTSHIMRAQGTFVSDGEVNRVCDYLSRYPVEFSKELVQLQVGGGPGKNREGGLKERDELYESAIEVVIREQRGSTSLLQRALGIGYGRAARLIDYMHEDGIVGEFKSGSAREVLYTWDEWESIKNGNDSVDPAA